MDMQEYEEQLAELSEKELLLEILVELKSIRHGLQTGQFEGTEEPEFYQCELCGQEVQEDDLENHAEKHGLPANLNPKTEFSEL